jgi:putative transposase
MLTCHGIFPQLQLNSGPSRGRTATRTARKDAQIIDILKEQRARAKYGDLCRRQRVTEGTLHGSKAKYSGVTVSDAKWFWALWDENAKVKKLLAQQPDTWA